LNISRCLGGESTIHIVHSHLPRIQAPDLPPPSPLRGGAARGVRMAAAGRGTSGVNTEDADARCEQVAAMHGVYSALSAIFLDALGGCFQGAHSILGRSGPNLEPGTMRVYVTSGPRNGLHIGRKVGPCPGTVGVG